MQIDLVPVKKIALSALPIKDVKVRRFFILADGKKSWREIYRLCMVDEEQGNVFARELVDGGYLEVEGVSNAAFESSEPIEQVVEDGSPLVPTADFVQTLTTELANFVGPVATILVNQLQLPEKVIGKGQVDKIIQVLAMEIDGEEEKKQFLANMTAIF